MDRSIYALENPVPVSLVGQKIEAQVCIMTLIVSPLADEA